MASIQLCKGAGSQTPAQTGCSLIARRGSTGQDGNHRVEPAASRELIDPKRMSQTARLPEPTATAKSYLDEILGVILAKLLLERVVPKRRALLALSFFRHFFFPIFEEVVDFFNFSYS